MIRHQYVSVYGHSITPAGVTQAVQVTLIVLFGTETGVAVIATLYHVTGYIGLIHSRFSGHESILFVGHVMCFLPLPATIKR